MSAGVYNMAAVKGLTFQPVVFRFQDADKNAIDITGWQFWAEAREDAKVINLNPTITDATAGEITLEATDEQTTLWERGDYDWDLIAEDDAGVKFGPIVTGRLGVSETITQSA